MAYGPRRPVDQHAFARLHLSHRQRGPSGLRRHRHGAGLGEGQAGRLGGDLRLVDQHERRMGAAARELRVGTNFVAHMEGADLRPHRIDDACAGPAEGDRQVAPERLCHGTAADLPLNGIDAAGLHPDQNIAA